MRTLTVRFYAAEDGAPIEGNASLLAGRWRTAVDAKQRPAHGSTEVRFDVEDTTVVNEVLVTAIRRFQRFIPWPKSDILAVKLEKASELIIAVNHDVMRLVQVHATGGQESTDHLRSLGKEFHPLHCGHSLRCSPILPGSYRIDVFDDAKRPISQLDVDLPVWRTIFIEVP